MISSELSKTSHKRGWMRSLNWSDLIATRMSGCGKVETVVPVVVGYSLAIH